MKKIRVGYTNRGNVLAIPNPTAIAKLLEPNESIVQNWYYNQPQELESFLKQNPNQENHLIKAFAYWVENKLKGCKEIPQRYGTLKRELQKFSKHLFKTLRLIAGRIARDIYNFLNPNPKKIQRQIEFYKIRGTIVQALAFEGFIRRRKFPAKHMIFFEKNFLFFISLESRR